ncbi:MAG TPA: histidine kinase, partial [Hymenobacter sp.]
MSEVLANNSPPIYLPQIGRATPAGVSGPPATALPHPAALPALPGRLAKHGELGLHLLFWTLYLVYPLAKSGGHPNQPFNYPFTALQTGTSLLPVYAFYLLLLPRLFAARQYGWLALAGLVLATSFAALSCYLNHAFLTECKCSLQLCIMNTTPEKASLLLFFGAVFVFKEHHRKQKELEHLEKERLGAELGYLRAQVNPHYLFNTLN